MTNQTLLRRCSLCAGTTRTGTTTLEFEFEGVTVIIDDVPATICDDCGETYVSGPLAAFISDMAAEIAASLRQQNALSRTTVRTHMAHQSLTPTFA